MLVCVYVYNYIHCIVNEMTENEKPMQYDDNENEYAILLYEMDGLISLFENI